ncbi:MAG: hypothetical protein Q4E43_03155, partial [Akkermansia sp.]|nr:hypothetical protein [Akkermansia sp.]
GIALCIISSAAVQALSVSTMFSRDIIGDLVGVKSDRAIMLTNRIGMVVVAILVATFCLVNWQGSSLWLNYLSMALRGGGVVFPLTLAIFLKRKTLRRFIPARWVVASMVIATLGALAVLPVPQDAALVEWLADASGITAKDIHDMLPVVAGMVLSALVLLIGLIATAIGNRRKS